MTDMNMEGHGQHGHGQPWWRTRSGIVLCGFLLIAAFYLLTEHTAHVFGVLPFLLILACPLMHLFMHHGHGGDSSANVGKGDAP
jgi:peptidoglycan/LPS O-acetylase OafA/YrhL